MKYLLEELNSIFPLTEGKMSKLEDLSKGIMQSKEQRLKPEEKEQPWVIVKHP